MKQNNPIKLIDCEKIEYESTLETIKLLLATINADFKKEFLDNLIDILSWSGVGNDKKDYIFLSKSISKTKNKIEEYFHLKDLKEMDEYKRERKEM